LRDPEVPAGLAELATNNFGKLEGLVNNAGAGIAKEFQDLSDADWEDQFNLHVRAPAALCRATSQLLKAARGAVVNISSLAAVLTVPKRVAYGAAKAGVEGLTRTLACEWAKDGVRVNAIAPGTIATPLVDKNLRAGTLDRDRVLERTPMGRFGTPQEIASVASFLLSDDAAYMTGQVLRVDGGWSVWGGWT
ncbi:MAG: SDR family NAD(P)-dependent oxidoreductase, partial [Haloechinothrix sp.]